jgi:hypothetical protein
VPPIAKQSSPFRRSPLGTRLLRSTNAPCQVNVLLCEFARAWGEYHHGDVQSRRYSFLGYTMCARSWRRILGVNPTLALKQWRLGHRTYHSERIERTSEVSDAIHGSLLVIIKHFEQSNPYSHFHGKDLHSMDVLLPFTSKKTLFLLLKRWWEMRHAGRALGEVAIGAPGALGAIRNFDFPLTVAPKYTTFLNVLRRPEFAHVKFHRFVNMERCPKCCLYRYKLLTCRPDERAMWERLASDHQFLQIAQKRRYSEDRALAASDFPRTELYLALDGGSGFDYLLPHFSPNDAELPSKAAKGIHTLPMKVMNGLVHGDSRSHAILSPGSIVAGANHLCECIATLINTAFRDHGDIPGTISVQLDNASVNHNSLTLGFMGLYVPVRKNGLLQSLLRGTLAGVERGHMAATSPDLAHPRVLWAKIWVPTAPAGERATH